MKTLQFDDSQGEYDPKAQALQDAIDHQNAIKQTNVALDNQFNDQTVPPAPIQDVPPTFVPPVATENNPSQSDDTQSPVSKLQSLLGNREPSVAPQPKPIKSSVPEPILRQLAASGNDRAKQLLADAYGPELGDSALKQALAQKNENTDVVGMGAAANQLAKGLASFGGGEFNPDTPELKLAEKQAGQPVEDILTRRQGQDEQLKHQINLYGLSSEEEKANPNSAVSKMGQDILQQMADKTGMKIDPNGMSLASVEKVFGPMEKYFASIESQKTRQAIAEQNALSKKSDLDRKNQELEYKHLSEAQKNLQNNKNYLDATKAVESAGEAIDAVNEAKTNPIASETVKTSIARLLTHGQRINQAEINQAGGSKAILASADQFAQSAKNGTLTPQNIKYMTSLINTLQKSSQKTVQKMGTDAANRLSKLNNKPMQDNYSDLLGQEYQSTTPTSDMVNVISPEGVSGMIPRNNLEKAKARGFKEQ